MTVGQPTIEIMNLMIVDDHAGVRRMIRDLLAAPGDLLQECASADEAVSLAGRFRPDCVTMDVHMPGQSAFAATRAIRAAHPDAHIVIVSSYDEPGLRLVALAAGAAAYVNKDNLAELPRIFSRNRGAQL
jgi:DNA-binding NarL/FixJ family response regulator